MSDINSSLPIRTQNNGDVVINIADGTIQSQLLAVDSAGRVTTKLDDGAGNVITSQSNGTQRALDVGVNVAGVQVDPRAIRSLTSADTVTANQGSAALTSAAWPTKLTDGTNTAAVKAASTAAAATDPSAVVALSPNSPLPAGTNTLGAVNQGTPAASLSSAWPTKMTDGTNAVTIKAASTAAAATDTSVVVGLSPNSALPAGTNALGSVLSNMQVAGAPVTTSNPVPVTISSSVPGTPIQNYNTAASVASAATSIHSYTVSAAKTFNFQRVYASASGKLKVEVQVETGVATGVYNTKFVGFNSTATPNIDIAVTTEISVAAGVRVQIIRTNEDKNAQDLYSTIEGTEV